VILIQGVQESAFENKIGFSRVGADGLTDRVPKRNVAALSLVYFGKDKAFEFNSFESPTILALYGFKKIQGREFLYSVSKQHIKSGLSCIIA